LLTTDDFEQSKTTCRLLSELMRAHFARDAADQLISVEK
jgi:hypothetical protein